MSFVLYAQGTCPVPRGASDSPVGGLLNTDIDVAGMKRTCRSERVPQGVSSVQGEGREALPAHVSTCATASPSPANEEAKLTMYAAPQSAAQKSLCCPQYGYTCQCGIITHARAGAQLAQ